ncbi:sensor histidine kinase [Cohnella panacarvi]|uniref:sensor histidine kinase n=1 Tax=Cohnella panacarvi TaxID=400776 RepID=UPI00047E92E3|nr:histidine kinase [Cohnella panacarvi]
MARGSLGNHFPLLRVLAILLGLLILIAWGLISLGRQNDRIFIKPVQWQPAAAGSSSSAPPQTGWKSVDDRSDPYGSEQDYWLRLPLEAADIREPELWILNAASVSVYDGDKLLYAYNPSSSGHRLNLNYHWNLAPLSAPLPPEAFVLIGNDGRFSPEPSIQLINKGDLIIHLVRKDLYCFLIGGLFLFFFFFALGLYSIRRDRLHLYLAMLSLCGSYATLVRNYLLQWLWDQPWLSYMELGIFPLGVFGFISIMNVVFDEAHTRHLRWLRWLVLGFAIATLASAVLMTRTSFEWLISYPLLMMFIFTAGFVLKSIWSAYQDRQGTESIWMLAGFLIVTAVALVHVLRTYTPAVFNVLKRKVPLLGELPFDILSVGLFLFLVCLIRVIISRFGALNEQLKAFNASLEHSVARRTSELRERESELQDANARLAHSMKETAEANASTMVLEERHRLTGTIHDTIGHSLTATIVQLEAAKRLLSRDPQLAQNKLEASRELVLRGLEQIRQSANLMRDDTTRYDLQEAMIALIEQSEKTTGVSIERHIDPLPDNLTTLQKRVLYQALQEGITNGLKHSGSQHFRFSLRVEGTQLAFLLMSDGRTYAPSAYGFGLKAMSERIDNLGGTMSISPGQPGCVLRLTLPYGLADNRALS